MKKNVLMRLLVMTTLSSSILGMYSSFSGSPYQIDANGFLHLDVEADDYSYLFEREEDSTDEDLDPSPFEGDSSAGPSNLGIESSLDPNHHRRSEHIEIGGNGKEEEEEEERAPSPSRARASSASSLTSSQESRRQERLRAEYERDLLEMGGGVDKRSHSYTPGSLLQRYMTKEEEEKLAEDHAAILHDCIMTAMKGNDWVLVIKIIDNCRFNPTWNGYEALRNAAVLNKDEAVARFLQHEMVDPMEFGKAGFDLFKECYENRCVKVMAVLIRDGRLPLSNGLFKSICNNPGAAGLLRVILKDPRFQKPCYTRKAMICATERGDIDLVKYILTEILATPSKAAFMKSIERNQLAIFKLLLGQPSLDPAASNNAALFSASKLGLQEMTLLLVQHPLVVVQLHEAVEESLQLFHALENLEIRRIWINHVKIFEPIGWEKIHFPHPQYSTLAEAASKATSQSDNEQLAVLYHLLSSLPFLSHSPRLQIVIDCLAPGKPKEPLIAFIKEHHDLQENEEIRISLRSALLEIK